jgi:hypothetical protein
MARQETDREDLLAEAVAMPRRCEARLGTEPTLITAGFRINGWCSVYFGSDPVYQWDADGRFRRGYRAGLLYRSQGTTIAQLRRERSATATTLLRHDLTTEELATFRTQMLTEVRQLTIAMIQETWQIQRQIPADDSTLLQDLRQLFDRVCTTVDWLAPAIAHR